MPNCDERFFHALPSRHRHILRYSVIPPEIKDAIFFLRGNCRRIFFLTLFHYFHIQNSLNFVEKFSTRKINYPGDFRDNRFFFFLLIRFFEWMDGKGEFFWSIPTHTHTHTGRTQNNGDITTIKIYGLLFAAFEKSASWKFHGIIKVACQRNWCVVNGARCSCSPCVPFSLSYRREMIRSTGTPSVCWSLLGVVSCLTY